MRITVFIKNTVILVATSLILRTVGILFRVHLASVIGSEGIGLYQLIFSVYMLAAAFATSGISTAVTRLVADNLDQGKAAARRIMRLAASVTLAAAAASSAVIFFGAKPIAVYFLRDERAILSLKILSLSLPFMGLSSCARGYFIACRKTLQPSLVQMFEQAVRIAVVLGCLSLYASKGLEYCAAAVLFGDTVAETASFAVNWILYLRDSGKLPHGTAVYGVCRRILKIALPITGGSYVSTALHTAENLLVPSQLSAYHGSKERGLELFGAIRGMAMPILFFPASFLSSLSTMLIPEVSSAAAAGNRRKVTETVSGSMRIAFVLSVFTACVFLFNAGDIGLAVYNDRDVGQIIQILAPIVPFMYLESIAAGMLKGLDRQMNMFRCNCIDSVCRIAGVFLLLPYFGIKGYLGIMIVSNCFTSGLNCRCLFKASKTRLDFVSWILKPALCGVAGGMLGTFLSGEIESVLLRLIVSAAVQGLTFLLLMPATGAVKREEMRFLRRKV